MKYDAVQTIKEPEKIVLDFLNYLEKDTQIKFDILTLSGISAWVTTEIEELNTTVCMPAEFYSINTKYMTKIYNIG